MNAAAVFVGLLFILITVVLIRFLGQAAGGQVPADAVIALIGFTALNWMPIALSLAMFVAILLTLSRVWRDSEMVVWFASGQPLLAWVNPVLRFALPVVVMVGVMSLYLAPWAQKKAAEYRTELEARDEVSRVTPGVFRETVSAQRVFYVESVEGNEAQVKNVFVASLLPGKQNVTVAAQGHVQVAENGDRFVVLQNGRRYDGEPGSADFRVMEFERYALRIEPKEIGRIDMSTRTASTTGLMADRTQPARGELLRRFGMPVLALVLALLAIPLAVINPRSGRAHNLLFAVLIFTIYFNLLGIGQAWVSQGRFGFASAAALTHLPMFALLVFMLWRLLNPNRRLPGLRPLR